VAAGESQARSGHGALSLLWLHLLWLHLLWLYLLQLYVPTMTVYQVSVCYRDEMWWSRNGLLDADAPPKRSRDAAATATATAAAAAGAAGGNVRVKAEGEGGAAAAAVAAPIVKTERRAGEAPRAPDGKRRKLAVASEADEVIVLSD